MRWESAWCGLLVDNGLWQEGRFSKVVEEVLRDCLCLMLEASVCGGGRGVVVVFVLRYEWGSIRVLPVVHDFQWGHGAYGGIVPHALSHHPLIWCAQSGHPLRWAGFLGCCCFVFKDRNELVNGVTRYVWGC